MTADTNLIDQRGVLDTVIDAARLAAPALIGADGRQHLLVPKGYEVKDITDPHRLPPRPKSAVVVDDSASLTAYVNRFKADASLLVADYTAMKMTATLDWHHHNDHVEAGKANACAHTATLQMLPSEEWTRWNAFEGELRPQQAFAEFLEENAVNIEFPGAAQMLEISRDLEAESGSKFKSRTRLQNGDVSFTYQTETNVTNDVVVPDKFTISIPLYNGEPPELLTCLFRYRATPSGLLMGFKWHRVEYQRRAHFELVARTVAEDTGIPVIFGRRST